MQSRNYKYRAVSLLGLVVLSVTFLSFLFSPGGDHFEIYLNKKLVLHQFVIQGERIKAITLDHRNLNEQVDILYSHCGKIGSKRTILIKEGKNILKQWRFSDGSGTSKFVTVGAKEILLLQSKNGGRKLNLYYSSEQLPEGRILATIIFNADSKDAMP